MTGPDARTPSRTPAPPPPLSPPLARRLARLHAAAFPPGQAWSADAIAALAAQPGVEVLQADGGFLLLRTTPHEAEILTLAVEPAARRRGLGARLVLRAVASARAAGCERLLLEVASDNLAARALYARADFQPLATRPAYYARADGPAVDALLLVLNLSEPA